VEGEVFVPETGKLADLQAALEALTGLAPETQFICRLAGLAADPISNFTRDISGATLFDLELFDGASISVEHLVSRPIFALSHALLAA
jgi:hypothetical protein